MISVIIPIFNEEKIIGTLLNYLVEHASNIQNLEIIVVDGGSTDTSKKIVQKFKNVVLLNSEKGRAKQMNAGAKNATHNTLYFLHADSFPPKHFDAFIIQEIEKGNKAGCFKMQFNSTHWWLKLAGWFTKFNWQICRGGDQSLFITKLVFNSIGGYNENYIICEDAVLINALYKRKTFTVINKNLITSARLYETHGVFKLQYYFLVIHIKKWMGADASVLKTYYNKHVSVKKTIKVS